AKTRGEGDVGAQQVDPGALELIQRPGLCRDQEPEGRVQGAGLEADLGGGPLAAPGSAPDVASGVLGGSRRRWGGAPGPPIWVGLGVGGFGQGAMHAV